MHAQCTWAILCKRSRRNQSGAYSVKMDGSDETAPLSPGHSPSPDEMVPSRYDSEDGKPSRLRKFFCSQTGLFVVLGIMLLAVVTVLLITGIVVPNVINSQQHALPSDPLERARALLKQSPLIDG